MLVRQREELIVEKKNKVSEEKRKSRFQRNNLGGIIEVSSFENNTKA